MVIQSIEQLEAEYTTVTKSYVVMLSVKKSLKDRRKDKFYGFKVGQVLVKLSIKPCFFSHLSFSAEEFI
jgi:hypothetical protein